MSITSDILPANAPLIDSFGAGGQMYVANLWGGFNISSEQNNPLFSFRSTDRSVPHAGTLTNLSEAGKIGSTMEFKAVQLGLRLFKYDGEITAAQVQKLKALLASATVVITLGSNETKIAEFSGLHLMSVIDFMAASAAESNGAIGERSFIKLQEPVGIQANCNIGGYVKFADDVPTELYETADSFGFVVLLAGLKVVK